MPNKPRMSAKLTVADLALTFERMGGIEGLAKWARRTPENQRFYWTQLFPRLLTLLERDAEGDEVITIRAARWLRTE